jgi:hypothetical protein
VLENSIETIRFEPMSEPERSYEKPAQIKLKKEIDALNANLVAKKQMWNSGQSEVTTTEIAKIHSQIEVKKKRLKRTKNNAQYRKDSRAKFKQIINNISEKNEEIGKLLKSNNRKVTGRPRLETDQPEILGKAIKMINR